MIFLSTYKKHRKCSFFSLDGEMIEWNIFPLFVFNCHDSFGSSEELQRRSTKINWGIMVWHFINYLLLMHSSEAANRKNERVVLAMEVGIQLLECREKKARHQGSRAWGTLFRQPWQAGMQTAGCQDLQVVGVKLQHIHIFTYINWHTKQFKQKIHF